MRKGATKGKADGGVEVRGIHVSFMLRCPNMCPKAMPAAKKAKRSTRTAAAKQAKGKSQTEQLGRRCVVCVCIAAARRPFHRDPNLNFTLVLMRYDICLIRLPFDD